MFHRYFQSLAANHSLIKDWTYDAAFCRGILFFRQRKGHREWVGLLRGARYYGSSMGRFTSPDDGSDQNPFNPQSWNLYSYGRNNPLIGTDPDGHVYYVCPVGVSNCTSQNGTSIDDKTFEAEQKQDQAIKPTA